MINLKQILTQTGRQISMKIIEKLWETCIRTQVFSLTQVLINPSVNVQHKKKELFQHTLPISWKTEWDRTHCAFRGRNTQQKHENCRRTHGCFLRPKTREQTELRNYITGVSRKSRGLFSGRRIPPPSPSKCLDISELIIFQLIWVHYRSKTW